MAEPTTQLSSAAPGHKKPWVDNIATVSTALIAIGTLLNWFFGKQSSFPHWFFYVLTFLIVVILYKYFEESIRQFIQIVSVRNYLRQSRFQLVDSLQRFSELVAQRSEDSIVRILQDASTRLGRDVIDKDLVAYFEQILSNILLKLSDSGKEIRVAEFKGILNDLTILIKFAAHFYFKRTLYGPGTDALTADELKSSELARENFADFVRRYQIFYDEVHAKLGSTSRAHFEIPKPLSYGVSHHGGG